MPKLQLFVFNEPTRRQFFGFKREISIPELPVWGNFKVQDLLALSIPRSFPSTPLPLRSGEDVEKVIALLESQPASERVITGRSGNVIVTDWHRVASKLEHARGITKIQIEKVPTEYYSLRRKDLIGILKDAKKRKKADGDGMLPYVFETVLFSSFERIEECAGYSFRIRNSFEYYQENLRINEYLLDLGFLRLYGSLKNIPDTGTVVGKSAVIKNSLLGSGTRVDGLATDSVLFGHVTVGRGARIKSSVILPFNVIEEDVSIENALVLGGAGRVIGGGAVIGNGTGAENGEYPKIIKRGLTILGEGLNVPPGSWIGAGCLVRGEHDRSGAPLHVPDGDTETVSRGRPA